MTNFLFPFPEEDAKRVVKWAKKVGVNGVEDVIKGIRLLIGDPPKVQQMSSDLKLLCATALVNAQSGLESSKATLRAQWKGAASDEAQTRIEEYEKDSKAAAEAFDTIGDKVLNMHDLLIDSYKDGLKFITECAKTCLDFENSLASAGFDFFDGADWLGIGKSLASDLFKDIKKFLDDANTLFNQTMDKFNAISKEVSAIQTQVTQLTIPDTMGNIVSQENWWMPISSPHEGSKQQPK